MAAAYLPDREFSQGSTYVDEINITDSTGDPVFLGDGEPGLGSGDYFGDNGDEYYEALFQIREEYADLGGAALVELTDLDAVILGDGVVTITLTATQTEEIVSATSARVIWAELDLTHQPSGERDTYRWRLRVQREYARGSS